MCVIPSLPPSLSLFPPSFSPSLSLRPYPPPVTLRDCVSLRELSLENNKLVRPVLDIRCVHLHVLDFRYIAFLSSPQLSPSLPPFLQSNSLFNLRVNSSLLATRSLSPAPSSFSSRYPIQLSP